MAKAHTGQPSPHRHVDSEVIATRLWFMEQHENAFENFTQLQQTGGDSLAFILRLSHRERGPSSSVPWSKQSPPAKMSSLPPLQPSS